MATTPQQQRPLKPISTAKINSTRRPVNQGMTNGVHKFFISVKMSPSLFHTARRGSLFQLSFCSIDTFWFISANIRSFWEYEMLQSHKTSVMLHPLLLCLQGGRGSPGKLRNCILTSVRPVVCSIVASIIAVLCSVSRPVYTGDFCRGTSMQFLSQQSCIKFQTCLKPLRYRGNKSHWKSHLVYTCDFEVAT